MNFTEIGTYIFNGEEVEYHYSPTATYMDQIKFVKSVGDAVVNENGYIPLL